MSKKRNKTTMNIILTLFISLTCLGQVNAAEYENYYGIEMTNEEYNNLTNLGFTNDEIYYMNEETYLQNKDIEANLVSKNQKYYKTIYNDLAGNPYSIEIDKEEYDNQPTIDARGTVQTEYKTMVSIISQNGNKFRYKVSLAWKKMPAVRSFDVIGVGFVDSRIDIDSSVYFNYNYCQTSGNCYTESYYYDKKSTQYGGAAVYDLPNTSVSLGATLYYDVAKTTNDTITRLDMCGDYSHATSNISSSNIHDYSIGGSGIQLYSQMSPYYDSIPCAPAAWEGSW